MTFDPFGDFETQGYLRNLAKEKDLDIVRRLEHTSFTTGLDAALEYLGGIERLFYPNLLETHRILFEAVYPRAGQDRLATAPDLAISKGRVLFARPQDIRRAVEFALKHGQDAEFMRAKPGLVMGYLAYAHPFLDGNGRAGLARSDGPPRRLQRRLGATAKDDYLSALTNELDDPDKGHLDGYLKPFIRGVAPADRLALEIAKIPGLDRNNEQNTVLGKTTDPALKARYEQQELKRRPH